MLPDSCHPYSNIENIPLSLAIRILRICSETHTRELRYSELKNMLLERNYPEGIVDAALNKARQIPRSVALRKVVRNSPLSRRPIFVVSWDPRLPSVSAITNKHWRTMTQDPLMKEIFSEPPLIAYKRQRNIGDKIFRAKVCPNIPYPRRNLRGMKKCQKECHVCSYIQERKSVKSGKFTWSINDHVDCNTENIIYLIQCDRENCKENKYIGESERAFHERLNEHRGYINRKDTRYATGEHFNQPGHSLHNMKGTILEKVKSNDPLYRKEREKYFIQKFNSYHKGMNRSPGVGSS